MSAIPCFWLIHMHPAWMTQLIPICTAVAIHQHLRITFIIHPRWLNWSVNVFMGNLENFCCDIFASWIRLVRSPSIHACLTDFSVSGGWFHFIQPDYRADLFFLFQRAHCGVAQMTMRQRISFIRSSVKLHHSRFPIPHSNLSGWFVYTCGFTPALQNRTTIPRTAHPRSVCLVQYTYACTLPFW